MLKRSEFKDPLPGVPLIENPFFWRLSATEAWDAETHRVAADLRSKGYAILDFPDEALAARAEAIKTTFSPRYAWDAWRAGKIDSLRIQDACVFDENVKSIAANARILDLLTKVFGRRAFPFQTLNFAVGTQQHVHTDSTHFSSVPERFMCGVWLALEDVDEFNGPLILYPGSHTWPVYTNEQLGVNAQEQQPDTAHYVNYTRLWQELIDLHGAKPERFLAKKGQALIWLANLLHGGDKQHALERTRWSQVTHYFFEGCVYYTPLLSTPFYGNIHFRHLTDFSTGEPVNHTVGGYRVPDRFIEAAKTSNFAPRPVDSLPPDFDPQSYLTLNPDVAAANVDAATHYLTFGWREGRRWE
ncbi:MAG: phytanoyl-CoA dioxygenase family protein [Xanthobacteraceae bacterium]